MSRSILYVGDRAPGLPAVVKGPPPTQQIVDLTGYSGVLFALRQAHDTANKFEAAAVVVAPATSGAVRYDLGVGDLNVTPGIYVGQWTLTDGSGRTQHVFAGEFEVHEAY